MYPIGTAENGRSVFVELGLKRGTVALMPHRREWEDEADCRVIAYAERKDDVEDKLIAAPDGMTFTKDEIAAAVSFQEKWYDTQIVTE